MTSRTIEMEQTTDIISLPVDIIKIIFKLLSRKDRKSLSLVNKRLLEIYKYEAGFKFGIVLDLAGYDSRLENFSDGMKILRESRRPFDQLTIMGPGNFFNGKNVLTYCQQILSNLEESISREAAQKVEYIVLHGCYDFSMVFLSITKLFPRLKSVGYSNYNWGHYKRFKINEPPPYICYSDEELCDFYKNQVEDLIAPKVEELVVFTESLSGFSRFINHLLKICPNIKKIRYITPERWLPTLWSLMMEEERCEHNVSYRSIERSFEKSLMKHKDYEAERIPKIYLVLFSSLEKRDNRKIHKMTADEIERERNP